MGQMLLVDMIKSIEISSRFVLAGHIATSQLYAASGRAFFIYVLSPTKNS